MDILPKKTYGWPTDTREQQRFLRKLKTAGAWASGPTPGQVSGQTVIWKDARTPVFTAALSTVHSQTPLNRRVDKEDAAYINSGKPLSHQEEWHNAICSNTDRSRDGHTKWRESGRERERQRARNTTYMWNLKRDAHEFIYETSRLIGNRLLAVKGRVWEGWSECGVSRHQVVYAECGDKSPAAQHRRLRNTQQEPYRTAQETAQHPTRVLPHSTGDRSTPCSRPWWKIWRECIPTYL